MKKYLGKKRGGCSTTDLSKSALEDCVNNAINLAKYTDEDDCAGLCDKDMICTDFKELERVYENNIDADSAAEYAILHILYQLTRVWYTLNII